MASTGYVVLNERGDRPPATYFSGSAERDRDPPIRDYFPCLESFSKKSCCNSIWRAGRIASEPARFSRRKCRPTFGRGPRKTNSPYTVT
jgi:hypothetical protein